MESKERHTTCICRLPLSPRFKKCLQPLGPLNWFEATVIYFSITRSHANFFSWLSTHPVGWPDICNVSSKQNGTHCSSWINSREHCGFAIKLLSAISKFIVLIVFTWLLCAHVLPRGRPYSHAPVIIFQQRPNCPTPSRADLQSGQQEGGIRVHSKVHGIFG